MRFLVALVKWMLSFTPYRLGRGAPNRFQSTEAALRQLKALGYAPRIIIDGGAHLGIFTTLAHAIFPESAIHMIEPQLACQAQLQKLAAQHGFFLHPYALSADSRNWRMMASDEPDTGAHLEWNADHGESTVEVKTTTLDTLFAGKLDSDDRVLLKLDLQGHELLALGGAKAILPDIEVVFTEVSFFRQAGEPTIAGLIAFFDRNGFDLFDVASLAGRTRDDRLRQGDFVFVRRGRPLMADKAWA